MNNHNPFSLPEAEADFDPRDPVTGIPLDESDKYLNERDEYIKKWRSACERLARVQQRAFDLSFDSSLHQPEVQESDFNRKRQALKKAVAKAKKNLREIEAQAPEAGLTQFLEEERAENLLAKEDEKIAKLKKRGLAATVGGNLITWSSLESRREWESEHGPVTPS